MYFILGVSVTLNIIFILASIIIYKKFYSIPAITRKNVESEFKEWRL